MMQVTGTCIMSGRHHGDLRSHPPPRAFCHQQMVDIMAYPHPACNRLDPTF